MRRLRKKKTSSRYFKPEPISGPSWLTEPVVIFGGVWTLTLFLLGLQMTIQIVPIEAAALTMIVGNIAFAAVLSYFSYHIKPKAVRAFDILDLDILEKYTRSLRFIWISGTLVEIYFSGGLPLQWAFSGQGFLKDYTDFGIPSFHGIMNAVYLQLMSSYLLLWKARGDKSKRTLFFILLFWPVLMLGRGIFLSVVVQSLGILLLMRRVKIKIAVSLLILGLGNIWLFGFIGNLRGTKNPFDYLIDKNWRGVFDALPDGFLWVYIYVTSGANNIFFNTANIVPSGFFDKTFSKLVPSFVWNLLGNRLRADNLQFADSNLNVSTMYAGSVSDFGPVGGFFFGCILLMFAVYIHLYARQRALWAMMCYCVLFQVLIFSVFYDMFLLLPTIMQFFIAFHFRSYLKRKRRARLHRFRMLGTPDNVQPPNGLMGLGIRNPVMR